MTPVDDQRPDFSVQPIIRNPPRPHSMDAIMKLQHSMVPISTPPERRRHRRHGASPDGGPVTVQTL
ncbi:hypothetical protein [Azospirillum argentinense]